MKKIEFTKLMNSALFSWYDFSKHTNLIYIMNENCKNRPLEVLEEIHIYIYSVNQLKEKDFLSNYKGYFQYVVITDALEASKGISDMLTKCWKLLSSNGKLLLGVNNRLGLRFWCGEKDLHTNKLFDGIEGYDSILGNFGATGRCFNLYEWKNILKGVGIYNYKFYSVYPSLEAVQLIYAENCFPNEEISIRYFPRYRNPDNIFAREEKILANICNEDLFHLLANAYLIECVKSGTFSDISSVTISMERGEKYASVTRIKKNGLVEKKAIFKEGNSNINKLWNNMNKLREYGVKVVEGILKNNTYIMPYIKAKTANIYLQKLLETDSKLFVEQMDIYREIVLNSSNHMGETELGVILKDGYIDLIPLNAFWIDGEYVFFDQEFCIENLPANVILYRAILIIYDNNMAREKILPIEQLWHRYGMTDHLDKYAEIEHEFLKQIRNQDNSLEFNLSSMRNENVMEYIRMNIENSDFYLDYIDNCFNDLEKGKVFLFGAGEYTKKFLALYKDEYNICGILDNASEKWGCVIDGIQVNSPENIVGEQDFYKVVICAKDYSAIFRQLKNMQVVNIGIYDANHIYIGRQNVKSEDLNKKYHIGYISGVFDLFHIGHLNMFKRAKEQCDYLIAGVTSDRYVIERKQREPYIPFEERIEMVRSCKYVDEAVAVPFEYCGTVEAFQKYHFDCQFCGSDCIDDPWWLEQQKYLREHGSELVFFPYTEQTSSTKLKTLIEKKLL